MIHVKAAHHHVGTKRKRDKFKEKIESGAEGCSILVANNSDLSKITTSIVRAGFNQISPFIVDVLNHCAKRKLTVSSQSYKAPPINV